MRWVDIAVVLGGSVAMFGVALVAFERPVDPAGHADDPAYHAHHLWHPLRRPGTSRPRPVDRAFLLALQDFPNADACLAAPWGAEPVPEPLDWDRVDSRDRLEVCLFRVLSRLTDRETTKSWMLEQGFQATAGIMRAQSDEWHAACYDLDLHWDNDEKGYLVAPPLYRRVWFPPRWLIIRPVWCDRAGRPSLRYVAVHFSTGW